MQQVQPKWLKSGLVLVCQKCYKERIPEETPEIAARLGEFDLRDWLKAKLKEAGHWGTVRVVGSTCLDVCAKGRVTVAIEPQNGGEPEVLVVDLPIDTKALYERIVERLG